MFFVDEETQDGLLQFDGFVVLHFGDRDVMPLRRLAVAISKNADVDIGHLDHLQRNVDRMRVESREVFHHLTRVAICPQAGRPNLFTVLRQVLHRTRNHDAAAHAQAPAIVAVLI
jgi:hypothetical protein